LVAWFVEETAAAVPDMLPVAAFVAAAFVAAAFVAAAVTFAADTADRLLAVQTKASPVVPPVEALLAVEAALVALGGSPASVALQTRGTAR
jgi:hypothetical protein